VTRRCARPGDLLKRHGRSGKEVSILDNESHPKLVGKERVAGMIYARRFLLVNQSVETFSQFDGTRLPSPRPTLVDHGRIDNVTRLRKFARFFVLLQPLTGCAVASSLRSTDPITARTGQNFHPTVVTPIVTCTKQY